jgi:hypothetical protein
MYILLLFLIVSHYFSFFLKLIDSFQFLLSDSLIFEEKRFKVYSPYFLIKIFKRQIGDYIFDRLYLFSFLEFLKILNRVASRVYTGGLDRDFNLGYLRQHASHDLIDQNV